MKLHEILNAIEDGHTVEFEQINKYKKTLYHYFKAQSFEEPILVVIWVFNAAQYCTICTAGDFYDTLNSIADAEEIFEEEERNNFFELVSFQSMPLKNLI